MSQTSSRPTLRRALTPGDTVDRYTLLERLGAGSMGEVWKAQHNELSAPCAVKILRPELARNHEVARRFVDEGRVCCRLRQHPNIIQIYDAGIDPRSNTTFLAMELLRGETLARWPDQRVAMPIQEFRTILPQLGNAVNAAHQAGIVHRDLKPENLFLTKDADGKPLLKVLDFGIARVLDGGGARTATQAGTPAYAAPEQLGPMCREVAELSGITIADDISTKTDIWALGLVAYELLTGCGADEFWGGLTLEDLTRKIVLEPVPIPTERAGAAADELPRGFDEWFKRCLERDTLRRWPTFVEATTRLTELIDDHLRRNNCVPSTVKPSEAQLASLTPPPVSPTPSPALRVAPNSPDAAAPKPSPVATRVPRFVVQSLLRRATSGQKFRDAVAYVVLIVSLMAVALAVAFFPRRGSIIVTVLGLQKHPLVTVQVFLDGQKRCDASPCVLSDLSVTETYTIKVAAPGFAESVIRNVGVERAKVAAVHVALARAPNACSLRVTAIGADLKLWIDGTEVGPLPQRVDPISPGEHVVRVGGNARYEVYEERISIAENEHRTIGPLKLRVLLGSVQIEPGPNSDSAKLLLVSGSERLPILQLPHRVELDLSKENRLIVTKPGYATLEQLLEFLPGQAEKRLVVSLVPLRPNDPAIHSTAGLGTLTIVSVPPSTVYLNSRNLGKVSRKNLMVSPGLHLVVFYHPQFKTRKLAITVETGRTAVASVAFP